MQKSKTRKDLGNWLNRHRFFFGNFTKKSNVYGYLFASLVDET